MSDQSKPLFRRERQRSGRGKKIVLVDLYTENEQSGTHKLLVQHEFGPGAEFPQTICLSSEDWTDDPPIPVTTEGLRFLGAVAADAIQEAERMDELVRTGKFKKI